MSWDPEWPAGDSNQFAYANGNPAVSIDPFGLRTYIIVLHRDPKMDDFLGEHVALYVDNGGHPIIYDPGADTQPIGGGEHPTNDIFEVPDMMTLSDYVQEDMREHLYTEIIPFDTDSGTEAELVRRIKEKGGVPPLRCARSVSEVLDGVGPFVHLGTHNRPAALARQLRRLKAQQAQNGNAR